MSDLSLVLRSVTFFLAIFAALVALQLYNLIRTGDLATTWRSFIIGAMVFAAWALADLAALFLGDLFGAGARLRVVLDLLQAAFIALFAGGLWLQRQMFYHPNRFRPPQSVEGVEMEHDDTDLDDDPLSEALA